MTNKNHGSYEMISTHNGSSVSDHQAFLYLCHCDDNNASVILNLQKNPPITFLPIVWWLVTEHYQSVVTIHTGLDWNWCQVPVHCCRSQHYMVRHILQQNMVYQTPLDMDCYRETCKISHWLPYVWQYQAVEVNCGLMHVRWSEVSDMSVLHSDCSLKGDYLTRGSIRCRGRRGWKLYNEVNLWEYFEKLWREVINRLLIIGQCFTRYCK